MSPRALRKYKQDIDIHQGQLKVLALMKAQELSIFRDMPNPGRRFSRDSLREAYTSLARKHTPEDFQLLIEIMIVNNQTIIRKDNLKWTGHFHKERKRTNNTVPDESSRDVRHQERNYKSKSSQEIHNGQQKILDLVKAQELSMSRSMPNSVGRFS